MKGLTLVLCVSFVLVSSVCVGQTMVAAPQQYQVPNLPLQFVIPTPQVPVGLAQPSPEIMGRPEFGRRPDVYVYHGVELLRDHEGFYPNGVGCYQRDVQQYQYQPQCPVQYQPQYQSQSQYPVQYQPQVQCPPQQVQQLQQQMFYQPQYYYPRRTLFGW